MGRLPAAGEDSGGWQSSGDKGLAVRDIFEGEESLRVERGKIRKTEHVSGGWVLILQ